MTEIQVLTALWTGAFLLVHLGVIARVILRPHRAPASRVAWIVVMIVLPVIGILTYILLCDCSIVGMREDAVCLLAALVAAHKKAQRMQSYEHEPTPAVVWDHDDPAGDSVASEE